MFQSGAPDQRSAPRRALLVPETLFERACSLGMMGVPADVSPPYLFAAGTLPSESELPKGYRRPADRGATEPACESDPTPIAGPSRAPGKCPHPGMAQQREPAPPSPSPMWRGKITHRQVTNFQTVVATNVIPV